MSKLINVIQSLFVSQALIKQIRYLYNTPNSILAFFPKKIKSLESLTQTESHLFHKLASLVIIYYFNTELTHIGSRGFGWISVCFFGGVCGYVCMPVSGRRARSAFAQTFLVEMSSELGVKWALQLHQSDGLARDTALRVVYYFFIWVLQLFLSTYLTEEPWNTLQ